MSDSPAGASGGGIQSGIVRGSLASLAIKLTSAGLVLALSILLARSLGPAGYGLYAYVYALVWLMVVPAELGLPMLVVRETARARAQARWDLMLGLWRWAAMTATGLGIAVALLAGGLAWLLAARFTEAQLATFAWGVLLAPLMVLGNLAGAALRGLRHVLQGQLPDLVFRYGLALVLCAGAVAIGGDAFTPDVAMALHAVAAAIALLAGILMLARARPPQLAQIQPIQERRAWLASTIPLALVAGTHLLHQQTDIVILGLFVDADDVGIYRVAVQASGFVAFGLQAVNMIAAPQFARLHALGEMERLQAVVTTTARAILALTALVAAGLVLFGRPVIGFAFGSEYTAGYAAIVLLAAGQICNAAFGSVAFLLNMTGHERTTLRAMAFAVAMNVGLNVVLIPLFGLEGAAAATATTLALWNFLLWRAVRRHLGIDSTALTVRVPAPAG